MDQTSSPPPEAGGTYAGGTIALHPELFSSPEFIAKKDQTHTYFCIAMMVILLITSVLFPRSMGASGLTYKLREIGLILAGVSFTWTALKGMKIWRFGAVGKAAIFFFFGVILFGMTTGLLLYHGVEERTDKMLQARPYNQPQDLMKKK